MTEFTEPTPEGIALGEKLTAEVTAMTEDMITAALLIEGEAPMSADERAAYDIGVSLGMAATMKVLYAHGMVTAPRPMSGD